MRRETATERGTPVTGTMGRRPKRVDSVSEADGRQVAFGQRGSNLEGKQVWD